jgi:hypothetical protein
MQADDATTLDRAGNMGFKLHLQVLKGEYRDHKIDDVFRFVEPAMFRIKLLFRDVLGITAGDMDPSWLNDRLALVHITSLQYRVKERFGIWKDCKEEEVEALRRRGLQVTVQPRLRYDVPAAVDIRDFSVDTDTELSFSDRPDEWQDLERPCCRVVGIASDPTAICQEGEHSEKEILACWNRSRVSNGNGPDPDAPF